VVNFLAHDRELVADLFASKIEDKFANIEWRPGANRMPVLHEASIAHAECLVDQEVGGGDHLIVIGRITGGQAPRPYSKPLMYFRRSYATWPQSRPTIVDVPGFDSDWGLRWG
jgi:flavin reductase (DIM6/NTAB) family NADH-FMN oxidoreductase RutF